MRRTHKDYKRKIYILRMMIKLRAYVRSLHAELYAKTLHIEKLKAQLAASRGRGSDGRRRSWTARSKQSAVVTRRLMLHLRRPCWAPW
jgi:hypothetical protein